MLPMKKRLLFGSKAMPSGKQFRILESECDERNWCLRFFVGKGLSDFLELWISPDLIEAGITIRDQTEFPPLQTPKEFKGGVAFAKFRLK